MKISSEKHHHHHHIKNLFKSGDTPPASDSESQVSSGGSHTGLAKVFRNNSQNGSPTNQNSHFSKDAPSSVTRTPSFLSLKRHNSNPNNRARSNSEHHHHHNILNLIPGHNNNSSANLTNGAPKEVKKLSKAATQAHLQSINTKNATRAQYRAPAPAGPVSPITPGVDAPHGDKIVYNPYGMNKDVSSQLPRNTSFYLSGTEDGSRILNNPVADPNDFLPPDLQQEHVNLLEDFEIDVSTKKLGDGGSSDVRLVNAINRKKEVYALKKFTLLGKETDEEFYKRVVKEYIISKKGSVSRHVTDVLGIVRIQSQQNLTRGWGIVLEFCSGGDLFSTIVKPGWKRTPLNEKFCLFKQIAYGLKALHDMDIVHRDLKPENILLDANGVAKLIDFGVSDYGHEIPGDFSSPVKESHSYVGSPPYSPPEVMSLREKSAAEAKNSPYNAFQMDHWGLGMLLFCMVYCGVPFQQSSVNDHSYRDYKFNHDRFASDHPNFKNGSDHSKGPGSEFKWASQFHSTGASRVAWKLCDPSVGRRYNLDQVFDDPWFQGLEMCIYEHPDQDVNPFVLPGTGENQTILNSSTHSSAPSVSNSQAPSRIGTVNQQVEDTHAENLHTPFRSMLDLAGSGVNYQKEDPQTDDNASIHSASSLNHTPLKLRRDDERNGSRKNGTFDFGSNHSRNPSSVSLQSDGSSTKTRSMLDIAIEPSVKDKNLPAVEELDVEHEGTESKDLGEKTEKQITRETQDSQATEEQEIEQADESERPPPQSSASSIARSERSISPDHSKKLPLLYAKVLRSSPDLTLDENGMCELGYKIKKHHHLEISTAAVSGRRR